MSEYTLYSMSEGVIFLILLALQIVWIEAGVRIGRHVRSKLDEPSKSPVSALQAAAMGLLALLLAFTFSMAAQRYEVRRDLVVEEANAIGTTWLRAQMLPDPFKGETSDLLRRYVDNRLEFYEAGIDQEKLRRVYDNAAQFQKKLWDQAVAVVKTDIRPITTNLFIQSLNQVIDLSATRVAAMLNRIPISIGFLLVFVSVMTLGLTGYSCGLGGRRHFVPTTIAALLITATIVLIIDLHRPTQGLIEVSQQSMLDLRDSLNKPAP